MNTRKKAAENEIEVLKAIANCGWLTTNLVARWVWQESKTHTAVNKAQLVLKRLVEGNEVLERLAGTGVKAWVLTQKGADRVNADLLEKGFSEGWAHHGYDISSLHFLKQVQIVEYLIEKRREGLAVVGKAGLRTALVDKKYAEFDAVTVNFESGYTVGVLVVSNQAESTISRVERLEKVCKIELIGDSRIVKGVQKKIEQRPSH